MKKKITALRKMEHFENEAMSGVHVMDTSAEEIAPHWHNHYEIDFCCGGTGFTILNEKKYPCRRGTVTFVSLSDVHEYRGNPKKNSIGTQQLKFINLNFNFNALAYSVTTELLYNFSGFVFQCDEEEFIRFESILRKIQFEDENNSVLRDRYIRNLLDSVLIEVYRKNIEYSENASNLTSNLYKNQNLILPHPIQKVIYYTNAHFKEQITLKEIAEYADIEYTSIGKYIKKYLKMSFKEYLTDIRLTYAKNLLCNTDVNITDLAFYCGYGTLTYFISEFKRKYGSSPREYRIKHTVGYNIVADVPRL